MELGVVAEAFGGGEAGRKIAAFILEVQDDLPLGSLTGKESSDRANPAKLNPTGSNRIKPDQTKTSQIKPDAKSMFRKPDLACAAHYHFAANEMPAWLVHIASAKTSVVETW